MRPILRLTRHISLIIASSFGALQLYLLESRIEKAKLKLELKLDDVPLRVPSRIKNLVVEVMNDMKTKKENDFNIEVFVIKNFYLKYLGSPDLKTKAFLGVPLYFSFEDSDDINFTALIDEEIVPKDSLDYKVIKDSFFLSKEAKKFGIAHELYEFLNSDIHLRIALSPLILISCNVLSHIVEILSKYPARTSYKVHAAIYFLGIIAYFLISDILIAYNMAKSDLLASELGKSYLKGGIEYYEKMIERNKIFKKLFENTHYTEDGDSYNPVFKIIQMPLSRRLAYLKDLSEVRNKPIWSYIFPLN